MAHGGTVFLDEVGRIASELGSQASRRMSPKRLKASTARLMASPGKVASQGACSMNARPVLLSMSPHPTSDRGEADGLYWHCHGASSGRFFGPGDAVTGTAIVPCGNADEADFDDHLNSGESEER